MTLRPSRWNSTGTSPLEEIKELRRVSRENLTYEQGQRLEYLESLIREGAPTRTDGVYMASTDGACRVWDSTTFDVDALGALKGAPLAKRRRWKPAGCTG